MQTQITTRHFDPPSALRDYAAERLAKLEQYYDGIIDVHLVLDVDHEPEKSAELTVNVYRQQLAAHGAALTHEEAIDECVERLRRQLLKYKSKLRSTDQNYAK